MRCTRSWLFKVFLSVFTVMLIGGNLWADHAVRGVTVTDSSGKTFCLTEIPQRIVSLVPGATETFFALGAGDAIVGLTYHDTYPREAAQKTIVGGFFDPSPELIEKARPHVILLSSLHAKIREKFASSAISLIQVDARTMEDGFRMIELVGKLADKNEEAQAKIGHIKDQLDLVSRKVAKIPESKRKRVMRLMGENVVMTPGDGSFQNELIRCAGGVPPSLGKSAAVVPVTQEEWTAFNPQVIYYCGNEWELSKKFFHKPGWKDVDAVKNGNYAQFPCDLTCRASVHMGYFVSWLAATVYPELFEDNSTQLGPDKVLAARDLAIDLPYVKSARVLEATMFDFPTQTLLIDFTEPMAGLSTLAGGLTGIEAVGNHYLSPPLWTALHVLSMDTLKRNLCKTVERDAAHSSFLYTGARMDSLAVQRTQFKDMIVYALVTAGVGGNAIRASIDEGGFYEPGTINIIVLTNMQLSSRARTRAIISATEAKSAALQDLDIRSSYLPRYPATGTGTDEVLVVEGRGNKADNAGGHSKLGELISKAVYSGVKESIALQNGLQTPRSVFRRLHERKIDLSALVEACGKFTKAEEAHLRAQLDRLLLDPAHAGLVEQAFALSDAYRTGLVKDLSAFQQSCADTCESISGQKAGTWIHFVPDDFAPKPVCMAFDALLNGLKHKREKVLQLPETFGACGQ